MLKLVAVVSVLFFIVQTTSILAVSVLGGGHSNSSSSNRSTNANISANASVGTGNNTKISDIVQPQRGKSSSSSSSSRSRTGGSSSKKHSPSSARFISSVSDVTHLPLGYRYKYASDYDSYVSTSYSSSSSIDLDTDIDGELIDLHIHEPIWFPLHYDPDIDLDLDLDLDDVDLDLDLLRLKYGLYGLNHYSLHNPRFNDYRFRRRYRYHSRPYFRPQHRYLPQYWKHDLDFWGLDNYGLGFSYDKFSYLDTPISYSSVSLF